MRLVLAGVLAVADDLRIGIKAVSGKVGMMSATKSYRSVDMAPTSAVAAAARYVERDYGCEGYRIGLAGITDPVNGTTVYAFQVGASDGSRFLVWADRFENAGNFLPALEAEIAAALDVEVS